MHTRIKSLLFGTALCALAAMPAAAATTSVDLELSLLVDISGSVDDTEFNLQKQGYVDAFNSASLWNAVQQGALGKIAVNLIYWSGASQQYLEVGWTLIDSLTSSQSFASAIDAASRPSPYNLTAPGSAIAYATPLFGSNDYDGTRNVIDVSGDGIQNDGSSTTAARDAFCGMGSNYAINGIAIGSASIETWYQDNLQCGTGSFTDLASGFDTFGSAIDKKLVREITGVVPLPASVLFLASGLFGLGALRRRPRKS